MDAELKQAESRIESYFQCGRRELALAEIQILAEHARRSRHPPLLNFIATALARIKRLPEAAEWAAAFHQAEPTVPSAWQLSQVWNQAGQPTQAERLLQPLLEACPGQLNLQLEMANTWLQLGKQEEGRALLERLLEETPADDPLRGLIHYNLHPYWMQARRFREAFLALLSRNSDHLLFPNPLESLPGNFEGKRVLLAHANGGAGDEIIFSRFCRPLRERGAHVIWRGHHGLGSLFLENRLADEYVGRSEPLPAYDHWIPIARLPVLLNLDESNLHSSPYLRARESTARTWKARIGSRGPRKIRVGLRWQATNAPDSDERRNIPLAELRPLMQIPGVEFYSLQRDSGFEEISPDDPLIDFSSEFHSWDETAGLLQQLDLVITCCTSVAHLAGALGRPTWLLAPLNCFYIWAWPDAQSPWYSQTTVYKQSRPCDWRDVGHKVREDLIRLQSDFTSKEPYSERT